MPALITQESPDTPDVRQDEAIGLYEQAGFYRISPFGPYTDDPLSRCYEKRLYTQSEMEEAS
ncbi:MAG TPA: hypothetical protein VMW27_22455 [Thermoanaerobaculia bacterium]|nr:hypothetical protein [Thermoanaerobaculia bacterium]